LNPSNYLKFAYKVDGIKQLNKNHFILILLEYLNSPFNMSVPENKIKLLEAYESHQESFFQGHEEDADLPSTELSGDENGS
jgi:hypothetical protein